MLVIAVTAGGPRRRLPRCILRAGETRLPFESSCGRLSLSDRCDLLLLPSLRGSRRPFFLNHLVRDYQRRKSLKNWLLL